MKTTETKESIAYKINRGYFFYGELNPEAMAFWKEAVKIAPEFVKEDLSIFLQGDKDFVFTPEYAEIFKPLGLALKLIE